uniref:VPS37B subunit of ESCRT-I n=1 Tax=Pipistrellus kuhlii TaxID=59472 RepID=A0A7J7UHI8_PIPKU|nr:VPS37B subunit of ESCRT-I [Pipistrellus kuhlii]
MAGAGGEARFAGLTLVQLNELLEDEGQLAAMVQRMEETQNVQLNKEMTLASNRSLAERPPLGHASARPAPGARRTLSHAVYRRHGLSAGPAVPAPAPSCGPPPAVCVAIPTPSPPEAPTPTASPARLHPAVRSLVRPSWVRLPPACWPGPRGVCCEHCRWVRSVGPVRASASLHPPFACGLCCELTDLGKLPSL